MKATAAALTVVAQGRTRKGGALKQIKLGLGSGLDGSGRCDAAAVVVVMVVEVVVVVVVAAVYGTIYSLKGEGAFVVVGT